MTGVNVPRVRHMIPHLVLIGIPFVGHSWFRFDGRKGWDNPLSYWSSLFTCRNNHLLLADLWALNICWLPVVRSWDNRRYPAL